MNNLKDIHNFLLPHTYQTIVVLSGFQWTIWRIYTTHWGNNRYNRKLFYQDFNEQFEGYTQPAQSSRSTRCVVLSGFQWTIWRIYTTHPPSRISTSVLFYQDFNEQFEGYTQHGTKESSFFAGCFIRISMNNLKDIHNDQTSTWPTHKVVLSGFQWTIWRIYTTCCFVHISLLLLFYQDFNEQFEGYTQHIHIHIVVRISCFIRISMNNLKDIHNNLC